MIILVVGNGFDLAHRLPTKYQHFLDFINIYRGEEIKNKKDEDAYKIFKTFINGLQTRKDKNAMDIKKLINEKNGLLNYFLNVYIKRCENGKDGWIDFESELADIIQTIDKAYKNVREREINGQDIALTYQLCRQLEPFICYYTEWQPGVIYEIKSDELYEIANRLLQDLNMISRLFELYLIEIIEKIDTDIRIPEIYNRCKKADAILSFNYTDTYRRLYRGTENVDCCFIHGKAREECNLLNNSNIVLGINEFLDTYRRNDDNVFIWFKKFYQRIFKETDSQYIDWINDDIKENLGKDEKLPMYIYFYGHSLDITDKDIIQKLIMYDNAIVRVFYHEKKEMGKQIANLTKIIGQENLIHMTRGRDRKIEFIQASGAINKSFINLNQK